MQMGPDSLNPKFFKFTEKFLSLICEFMRVRNHKPGIMVHTCDPSMQKAERGGLQVWLHNETHSVSKKKNQISFVHILPLGQA
jgi:hypothetical protein